jgi:serine/threonine-protein kinase HipA
MAFQHVDVLEVRLFGETVGALALDPAGSSFYAFEYEPSWVRNGFSISPLHLPLKREPQYFENLAPGTWHRLPAAISDCLPDRFGNSLIEARLAQLGVSAAEITPLDRLAYVGDRGMGALEFRPAYSLGNPPSDIIELKDIVEAARNAISGTILKAPEAKRALRHLLSVGTSAGGARPKAVVNINPLTGEITSGQRPEAGKESWLLKFDGVGVDPGLGESGNYGRIEYAYSLMATNCGITMPETRLLEENGRAHFMVRRFDRSVTPSSEVPQKIHMQSLCAMGHVDFNLIHTNEYASLFQVMEALSLSEEAKTEAFRRLVFNYLACNCDDHAKNYSFLLRADGNWEIAPAYDLTFAYNSQNLWLKEHLMGVDGKFSAVSEKDMLQFAKNWNVHYAKDVLQDVKKAISRWPEFATAAGIPENVTQEIAAHLAE